MDLDLEMILKGRNRLGRLQGAKISLYVGDVSSLPYSDGVLDAVFGFGVLHHVPDWQSALSEIARTLKSGGSYFLEELYPSLYQNCITRRILLHPCHNRFRSHDLKAALQETGLALTGCLELERVGILGVAVKK